MNALTGCSLLLVALSLGFALADGTLAQATDRAMAVSLWVALSATALAGGAAAALARMLLRRRAWLSAGVAGLTVALLAASTAAPAKGLIGGLAALPKANSGFGGLSLVTFGLATLLWSLWNWQQCRRRLATQTGALRLDARLARQLRRGRWRQWGASLLAGCPRGVLVVLLVGVPLTALTLTRTPLARGHLALPLVMAAAGLVLLTILGSMAAGLLCLSLVWLGGRVRLAGWVAILAGLLAGAAMFGILGATVGYDLRLFDVAWLLLVIPVAVSLLYATAVSHGILAQVHHGSALRRCSDWLRIVARAILLLPLFGLDKLGQAGSHPWRRRGGWLLLVGILAVLAMVMPSLPPDGVGVLIERPVSLLAVLAAVPLGYLLAPRRPRRWKPAAVTTLLLTAASLGALFAPAADIERMEVLSWQASPTGARSLQFVRRMLLLKTPRERMLDQLVPPKFLTEPTDRTAVMDDLKRKRPLIVLVIWDAAQGGRLSVNGYQRTKPPLDPTTPNLDKVSDQLLRFRHTFTQGGSTTTSLRCFFSSRFSSRWMERTEGLAPLWTNHLIRHGYHTFHLNLISSANDVHGICCQAFFRDMPDDLKAGATTLHCINCSYGRKDEQHPKATPQALAERKGKFTLIECNRCWDPTVIEAAVKFLQTRKDTKGRGTLLMVHLDQPHTPWSRMNEFLWYGDDDPDVYDHTIRACDGLTGRLIDGMKDLGMWKDAIFILIGDHGLHIDGGGSHPTHDRIHVPLLMKIPGVPGRNINTLTALFDVGPTLIDLFEPAALTTFEGRSLWPIILEQQNWDDRIVFGLSAFSDCYYHVRNDGRYFVRHRDPHQEELYNWRTDPQATVNRLRSDKYAALQSQVLMDWFLYVHGKNRDYALDRTAWRRGD